MSIDLVALAAVVAASATSGVLKEYGQTLWERLRKSHSESKTVTIVGPHGAQMTVNPEKPLTQEQIDQVSSIDEASSGTSRK